MTEPRIPIDRDKIAAFCQKWKITELSLFGSVLRDDFRPDSDVDVLVTFAPDSHFSLFDVLHAENELAELLERKVDLVERIAVEQSANYISRKLILNSARLIYAAA
jgi:predicted nucleotidyltransferase